MKIPPRTPPHSPSKEALFRYSVLAQVEALVLAGRPVGRALRKVARRDHVRPDGTDASKVKLRTLERWHSAYRKGSLAALEPKSRRSPLPTVILPEDFVAFMRDEKQSDPRASVPELIRRARVRDVITNDLVVDRTTAWRACCRMGLPTRLRPSKSEGDMRRWRYPHRMQCVLCDGKHFRVGPERKRRVALFFLDDATRYGLDVLVGTSESTDLFLRGLYNLVRRHGLMDLLYLDHGPGFISSDTFAVVEGGLSAWLVHGKKKYPQGHGAIERFNRTALADVLRALDGAIDVDADCGALTFRLRHYLALYNDRLHETLNPDTPKIRWEQGRPLRFPEHDDELYRRFVVREARKVSKDHVIKQGGCLWEAPRGLGDSWVEVTRHALDNRLWVPHEGRMVELCELDPHQNATDHRGDPQPCRPVVSEGVPRTAAAETFRKDLLPIVALDGGFADKDKETS